LLKSRGKRNSVIKVLLKINICIIFLCFSYLNFILIIKKLRCNSEDYLIDPDLCFENVIRFKWLIDSIKYDGPIAAITDNTKLKSQLKYSPTLGCIIRSVLLKKDTYISVYSDISNIITKIKSSNRIAKVVCIYLLQI